MQAAAPPGLKIDLLADQSLFVEAALDGVVREGLIAAALTATFILLFLGSWRSTLIVAISIPLSVLASLSLLSAAIDPRSISAPLSQAVENNSAL